MLTKDQTFGVARHILTTLGGSIVAKGWIDESMMVEAVGLLIGIMGFIWSFAAKKESQSLDVLSSCGSIHDLGPG